MRRIQEYILAGDAFQVVYSQRFRVPRGGVDPFDVYRALRVINPSPYMFHLEFPEAVVTGASPEVLVTVAIVSVLAAIVVPTVTSQIGKGDETQFQTTITNVRTGVTAFVSDARRFPRRVSQLFNPITATDNDLFGSPYGGGLVSRWKGPYVSGALPLGDSLSIALSALRIASTSSRS